MATLFCPITVLFAVGLLLSAMLLQLRAAKLAQAGRLRSLAWLALAPLGLFLLISWMLSITGLDIYGEFLPYWGVIIPPALLAALISAVLGLIGGVRLWRGARGDGDKRPALLYALVSGLVVLSFLLPLLGFRALNEGCEWVSRRRAETLIEALEVFRDDRGQYPESLEGLVPDYTESLPRVACDPLRLHAFDLISCSIREEQAPLLYYDTMDRNRYHRHELETGEWSTSKLPLGDWMELGRKDTLCLGLD